MKPVITWVLVVDGAQAKVFENRGPGKGLHAVADLQFAQQPLRAAELVTDRPGRSFSSVGSGRSAIEPSSDPVVARERQFVIDVTTTIAEHQQRGAFDRLVLVAPPTALGDLRAALPAQLRQCVTAEMPRDLTGLTTPALETHLASVMAV